jgi:hypothetical protein
MNCKSIAFAILIVILTSAGWAGGIIRGSTGGMERGANVYAETGVIAFAITGPSGLYEFHDIPAGTYIMEVNGRIVPGVEVHDGETTVVSHANQPKIDIEKELWAPAYSSVAQSYRALGTGVGSVSFWMAGGNAFMDVSLYEGDGLDGRRVAGPHRSEKECTWITGIGLPSDKFKTEPGKTYTIEVKSVGGEKWSMGMPRSPDPYENGIAYFDGVPHPESDLGITIDEEMGGFTTIAAARDDQHFIKEGDGSGLCTVAGQTFVANIPHLIGAYVNCGWSGGIEDLVYSIHKGGPGGEQVGPAKTIRMVPNWGSTAIWAPGEVDLETGETYYFQYRRADGEPFYGYLSSDRYSEGIAYRDGEPMQKKFDALFHIYGEFESGSFTYPYNVKIAEIGQNHAVITWQTGTPADSVVSYHAVGEPAIEAGDESERTLEHRVRLEGLEPGVLYRFAPSSHTHKERARRTYGPGGDFMTPFSDVDKPKYQDPIPVPKPPKRCNGCVPLVNATFENPKLGWGVVSATASVGPHGAIGSLTEGVDGYIPHSGKAMYGWAQVNREINPQTAENEWNYEIISQEIAVEPGAEYELRAWALTGNRESGWGGDCRLRLLADTKNAGYLEKIETADEGTATQWFATRSRWMPVFLRFTAESKKASIGVQFLQWNAKAADYLYVDDVSVVKLKQ